MIYAGIDAGGTSSKCMIINEENKVLAQVEAGSANYQVIGLDRAVGNIEKVIEIACSEAGISSIDIMGIGMAGAGSELDLKKIKKELLPLKNVNEVYLTNDGEIAVLGAHAGKEGIVLIAGTGSIVYGLKKNFKTIRAGGWGSLLGDEGSGFWIGLNAMKRIIKAYEGRERSTSLGKKILNYLKLNNYRELVNFIYQVPLPREKIASLAPIVINEMLKKDEIAREIVISGLKELALTVKVVADKIEGDKTKADKIEIAVMGGLFANQYIYREFSNLIYNYYGFSVIRPKYPAVYGAVLYGLRKSGNKLKHCQRVKEE